MNQRDVQLLLNQPYPHNRSGARLSGENRPTDARLELMLYITTERPCSVGRVVCLLNHPITCRCRQLDRQPLIGEPSV
mgnify:CR=1 FL=1